MPDPSQYKSNSAAHGLQWIPESAHTILSVGISTGGDAEIAMVKNHPNRHVIATTIDQQGIDSAKKLIDAAGLHAQIELRNEDISGDINHKDQMFDYIYARLVFHYLPKKQLAQAFKNVYRILKDGGRLFVVVRSTDCEDYSRETSTYDKETGITTYIAFSGNTVQRNFQSRESITAAATAAGFSLEAIEQYDENLYDDFARTVKTPYSDNLIEVKLVKHAILSI